MLQRDLQQNQAADCFQQAAGLSDVEALPLLRQAVLLYAEAHRAPIVETVEGHLAGQSEKTSKGQAASLVGRHDASAGLTRARAEACRRYGDTLARLEQHPEAANAFQEAADLFGQLQGAFEQHAARECARKALASIQALNTNPKDRLYLLIARYTRQQQQLAMQPGTEALQADCCLHVAQIFLRRDRPAEAFAHFTEALALYRRAEPTETVCLAQAECHHRLGNLLANVLSDAKENPEQAIAHYTEAIALYRQYEPVVHDRQERLVLSLYALPDLKRRLEKV